MSALGSRTYSQDFVRGTSDRQNRSVVVVGGIISAVLVLIVVAATWIYPRYDAPPGIDITLRTSYVGPGVTEGSKVILSGSEVGEVTDLSSAAPGDITIAMRLRPELIEGVTSTFDVDFRPRNYFGTTGINIVAQPGGEPLTGGETFERTPKGDFTMSTMIERGSLVVDGTLTTDIVRSLEKTVRYTDGLAPLIDTGITVADRVAATQRHLPHELMEKFDDILAEAPEFSRELIDMLFMVYENESLNPMGADGVRRANIDVLDRLDAGLDLASSQLFGLAGTLLASHPKELTPLTQVVTQVSDLIPHFVGGGMSPKGLMQLIDKYNSAFAMKGGRPTLDVALVVNTFPALAAPLSHVATGPQGGAR